MANPILFTLAAFALLLTPGPTNTLLAIAGATLGWRRSLLLLPAELAGYLIAIHLLGLVVGPFAQSAPSAQATLRFLSSFCVLIIGVKLWRADSSNVGAAPITPQRVFIVTLLNPKALVFAFAIVPALAAGKWVASLPYLFGLSSLIVGCGFAWLALGAVGGPVMRLEPSAIRRSGAVILLMFAAFLGWSAFARLWQ